MIAPNIIKKTELMTCDEGIIDKMKYSPIILMRIENLLRTVNIGKFKDCVPPKPHITFPKKSRKIGKISLMMLSVNDGMSMTLKSDKMIRISEVIRNCVAPRK